MLYNIYIIIIIYYVILYYILYYIKFILLYVYVHMHIAVTFGILCYDWAYHFFEAAVNRAFLNEIRPKDVFALENWGNTSYSYGP